MGHKKNHQIWFFQEVLLVTGRNHRKPRTSGLIDKGRKLCQRLANSENQWVCRRKEDCPLDGACLTRNVLYEAKVTSAIQNYGERVYIGITEPPFKERYANHLKSFAHKKYSAETELLKEIWKIKELNESYEIKWRIVKQCPTYTPLTKRCLLCLSEKNEIAFFEGTNLLNKKSEIVSTCRHRLKHSLGKFDVKWF